MNDNSNNVVILNGITSLDIPADRVLTTAIGNLDSAVVLGYSKDGAEYFASSIAVGPEVLWLLERLKQKLLATVDHSCEWSA